MVAQYPSNVRFDKEVVDAELRAALAMWEGVSKLKFIENISTDVDIRISFVEGEHEDHTPFDGPRGYLAHAFFPSDGGDICMDDAEDWTINSPYGTNLRYAFTHELGHSLGLEHSHVRGAIMFAHTPSLVTEKDLKLHQDDIVAVRKLYGEKETVTTTSTTTTTATTRTTTAITIRGTTATTETTTMITTLTHNTGNQHFTFLSFLQYHTC